jgi:Ca2+-binding RTX toxin-like protein
VFVVTPGDVISEQLGGGADTVLSATTWVLRATLEALVLTGAGAVNGSGNPLDNLLRGNDAANRLFGITGADTLLGGGGDDALDGGVGADRLEGGLGDDLYVVDSAGDLVIEAAGAGLDAIIATLSWTLGAEVETLLLRGAAISGIGNALDNRLAGNGAANHLDGAAGADTLDGAGGADTMLGGAGDDTYLVNNLLDLVVELPGEGIDTVRSTVSLVLPEAVERLLLMGDAPLHGTGNALGNAISGTTAANRLSGLEGNDILNGFDGADTIEGGEGRDRLLGGGGGDLLIGGAGEDILTGGTGADLFHFDAPADGVDAIVDFEAGVDRIMVSAGGFGLALPIGLLDPASFATDAPSAAAAQFVHLTATGLLAFDPDGTGGLAAIGIARLENLAPIASSDILLVA